DNPADAAFARGGGLDRLARGRHRGPVNSVPSSRRGDTGEFATAGRNRAFTALVPGAIATRIHTMRAHPDIVEIVAGDCEQCLRRSAPRPPTPAPGQSSCGAWIEELALGDERPEDLRARLEAARAAYRPDSPTAEALVLQATLSQLEVQRCHKIRAS